MKMLPVFAARINAFNAAAGWCHSGHLITEFQRAADTMVEDAAENSDVGRMVAALDHMHMALCVAAQAELICKPAQEACSAPAPDPSL